MNNQALISGPGNHLASSKRRTNNCFHDRVFTVPVFVVDTDGVLIRVVEGIRAGLGNYGCLEEAQPRLSFPLLLLLGLTICEPTHACMLLYMKKRTLLRSSYIVSYVSLSG